MNRYTTAFLLLLFSIVPISTQTKTIWQIGRHDQSSKEFQAKTSDHILYQAEKSDWAQDWPAEQRTGSSL